MSTTSKPIILVFVGYYLPGFKAGGILRSVENMVDHLRREFQFKIVTRDRDLGDKSPYPNLKKHVWQEVGNACVRYLEPGQESLGCIRRLIRDTPHDVLYLNSFFEPLNVKALFNRKLGLIDRKPIVVAPRGEFAWASLCQKYPKKVVFMRLARLIGLYEAVTWHASSAFEAKDIVNVMKIRSEEIHIAIHIALDLPLFDENDTNGDTSAVPARPSEGLRVVFLSRISPEKNLDFALKVLSRVRTKVTFDIIGPIENTAYWNECRNILRELPVHVTARSLGSIKHSEVMNTLRQYDLLFFPSGGENYGHVIAEALSSGTQVLISTNTPWRNLEAQGLGWDLPLDDMNAFVRVVDELGSSHELARLQRRKVVREKMRQLQANSCAVAGNRELFHVALSRFNGSGTAPVR